MKKVVSFVILFVLLLSFPCVTAFGEETRLESNAEKNRISTNNAVVYATVKNPNKELVSVGGAILYLNGYEVASREDSCVKSYQKAKNVPISYDMINELGYILQPGTTYEYLIYAVVGGITYSVDGSFTTTGGGSHQTVPYAFYHNGEGESAKFNYPLESCYVNTFAMIFQTLGNSEATPTSIYKFNGNTVYCKGTTELAKHYGFKAIRADKLPEYKNFKKLNLDQQETMLIDALSALPDNQQTCNLSLFGSNNTQIHMAMAYLDSDGELLVRDPGYSEEKGCDISYKQFVSQWRKDFDKNAYVYNFWYYSD